MSTIVKTRIVKIGNSQGVRIPKILLDQTHLVDEVVLEVEGERIVIRATRAPREGWEASFSQMAEHGDDQLLDAPTPTTWDETDWEW